MGFDWSDQAEEVIPNQALMAEVTNEAEIPIEVQSKLYTKACVNTIKKYKEHNESMCDNLKRLEQCRRESTLIISSFEEHVKAYQANELKHHYDQNYWNWEKNELEVKLGKS